MPSTNLTPATAIEVLVSALPYITTQNVSDVSNTQKVFYKLTNDLTHDVVITFWFYGTIPGNQAVYYSPDYNAYPNVGLTTNIFNAYPNCATEAPIKAGESYWIEIFDRGPVAGTNRILNINISLKPYSAFYPAGQIIIFSASSDTFFNNKGGLHAGFIDPLLGQIVNFLPFFPASEGGDILNNGTYLITDNSWITKPDPPSQAWYFLLLDSSFNITTRILFPAPTSGFTFEPLIRTNNATNKFWIAQTGYSGAPNRYASISSTGVISPIINLPQFTTPSGATIAAHATTNNESHLLLVPNFIGYQNLHKWNLSTLAWDGTIASDIPNYSPTDILVMTDDTIVVCYVKGSVPRETMIKRYSPTGTELNSIIISVTSFASNPRIGYAADSLYFWVWIPLSTGRSLVKKIKRTDFSVSVNFQVGNVYETSLETATPVLIYTSDSCPIIETRVAGGIPPFEGVIGAGLYELVPKKLEDTVYTDPTTGDGEEDAKIPNPFVKTAYIGS